MWHNYKMLVKNPCGKSERADSPLKSFQLIVSWLSIDWQAIAGFQPFIPNQSVLETGSHSQSADSFTQRDISFHVEI